jgi:hypothetical protein
MQANKYQILHATQKPNFIVFLENLSIKHCFSSYLIKVHMTWNFLFS